MKKVIEYLKRLDFSETESKLYMILLQKGSMSVADLANKAKINRTAAYGYIDALLQKGVISKLKGASNKVLANPPAQLHYLVDQKLSHAKILEEDLTSIVTLLNSTYLQTQNESHNDIRYYKGKISVKSIYKDVLKSDEIRSYFNGAELEKVFPENFELFDHAFDQNPKIKMYEVLEKSFSSNKLHTYYKNRQGYYYKYLPQDITLTSNDILIYDGKVAIINIGDKNNIDGLVLENTHFYNNSKQVFDLLWRLLPNT